MWAHVSSWSRASRTAGGRSCRAWVIRLAGRGVQPDGGVAGPVGGAQPGELVDRLVEDVEAVGAGGGGGQLAGAGEPQVRGGHEASWSRRASSEVRTKLFIGGGWVDGLDGANIEVRDPHDGSLFAGMAEARAPDVDRAVQAARSVREIIPDRMRQGRA